MHDMRAVEFVLRLPADVAESAEAVGRRDPEYLGRLIKHGLARRAVFQELRRTGLDPSAREPLPAERSA
ncbi:MAG: hypothetical protein R6X22_00705 [Gemmatimonadota bacterium]|jgi:hypothetical protein